MWQTSFRAVAYGLSVCTLLVSVAGCGSPKSKRATSSDAGVERDGGNTKLSELPGGYAPRIPCGDLGKSCRDKADCKSPLVCTGGLCTPNTKNTGSCDEGCPAKYPICLEGTCVSADQLGCMCLDSAAREDLAACAGVSQDPGSSCLYKHQLCDTTPTACCEGLTCLQGKDGTGRQLLGLCEQACKEHSECDDKCCLQNAGVAGKFCAPRSACQESTCREVRESCDGDLRECCEGLVCSKSKDDPELAGCQPKCEKKSQCATECCVLFTGLDHGICAPKDRCDAPVPP
jgi:hypothetical protein